MSLYHHLYAVSESSKDFVLSLNTMAKGEVLAEDSLHYTIRYVGQALIGVRWALRDINPQLSIHEPAIAAQLTDAFETRDFVISEAELALAEFEQSGSTDSFRKVAQEAEVALHQINEATELFRKIYFGAVRV